MALVTRKDPDPIKFPGLTARSYEIDFDASYATGGLAWDLSADFDVIKAAMFETKSGYQFELTSKDAPASAKVKAYRVPGFTPAGTNSAPTITITGGQGAGVAIQIDTDANGAVLGKTAATTRTGITGVQAPTFTGTAVAAAALAEVAAAVDLSAVTKVGVIIWGKKS